MPIDADIIAAQNPCCGLILVSDFEGIVEPVLDVGAPLQYTGMSRKTEKVCLVAYGMTHQKIAAQVNVHILQPRNVHD